MLSLVLTMAVAQAETRAPVGVVLTSRRPGTDAVAAQIAQRVYEMLKREGIGGLLDASAATKELKAAGFSEPRKCEGTRACVAKLALLLGPHAIVVGVDAGKVGKTLAIHLDAVAADRDEPIASLEVASSLDGWNNAMAAPIVVFAREVKAGTVIAPAAPTPGRVTSDAPVVSRVEPRPALDEPLSEELATHATPPRTTAWVVGGGAVVAAGVAISFGVLGLNAKSRWDAALTTLPDGSRVSLLAEGPTRALAGTMNTDFTVALASALVSAVLAGASVWLFTRP